MKINRICTLVTLLALLLLAATLVYGLNLWNIRGVQTSDVYRRYADTPGINAAYVKDYRVNDSVTVCVTLLEAMDSAGWHKIKTDFEILDPETNNVDEAISKGSDVLSLLRLDNACDGMDDNDVAVASKRDRYICIFHTNDATDKDAMLDILLDVIFNSLTNKKTLKQ
ncbi:MAG: hypothetical protein K5650_08045 [Bacteroidales bacterium]|nr:hypothetical protein [Bacteroidales bacterium]